MVDNKSLTGALVKMGLDREAAEKNARRIERVITEEAFEVIKKYFACDSATIIGGLRLKSKTDNWISKNG